MTFSYTDEQVKWLIANVPDNVGANGVIMWEDIVPYFNDEFEENKSAEALRKTYQRYKDLDFSEDSMLYAGKAVRSARTRSSIVAKENRTILDNMNMIDDIEDRLKAVVSSIKFRLYKPPTTAVKKRRIKRAIVAHYSDAHLGDNIDIKEIIINEYNSKIAARRTAEYIKQVSDYKSSKRKDTKLVLLLNGDLLQGVIHNQEGNLDLMTLQFEEIISIIGQAISYASHKFPEIEVLCNTGNHERMMHKMNKSRQTAQKWDSFASMAYIALKQVFKNYSNVTFIIKKTPYIDHMVLGKRIFVTHGDTTFNIGAVSKSVNITAIENQINKINNSDLTRDKKFDAFFIAHVHFPMVLLSQTGCHIFINGCVSGIGAFAQSIGIFNNQVVQQFIEFTEDHIGDMRFVDLRQADNNEKLDKIIKPEELIFED